jgi:hypothetical protein
MLAIKFGILIGRFTFLIFTVCYMEGMFWYLICDAIRKLYVRLEIEPGEGESNYIENFELEK